MKQSRAEPSRARPGHSREFWNFRPMEMSTPEINKKNVLGHFGPMYLWGGKYLELFLIRRWLFASRGCFFPFQFKKHLIGQSHWKSQNSMWIHVNSLNTQRSTKYTSQATQHSRPRPPGCSETNLAQKIAEKIALDPMVLQVGVRVFHHKLPFPSQGIHYLLHDL